MDRVLLRGTDLDTTPLGFGCGKLMRVRSRAARRRLLDEAFAAGIRHFDVARMYGLGAAERELGEFARTKRDRMVIATKFGIDVNSAGRRLQRIQGLVRPLLPLVPALRGLARRRAQRLYEPRRYDAAKARASLEASLREIGTDYVDLFLIHEPQIEEMETSELLVFLEAAKAAGKIRAYGVAGRVEPTLEIRQQIPALAPVIQIPNDAIRRQIECVPDPAPAAITFSPLSRSLQTIRDHFRTDSRASQRWSEAVGVDLTAENRLPALLLRHGLRANPEGVVVFSTSRVGRIHSATRCAAESSATDPALDAFMDLIRREIQPPAPDARSTT